MPLPWRCNEHPDAPIRHAWPEDHYVMNGYPLAVAHNQRERRYECAVCALALAPPTTEHQP